MCVSRPKLDYIRCVIEFSGGLLLCFGCEVCLSLASVTFYSLNWTLWWHFPPVLYIYIMEEVEFMLSDACLHVGFCTLSFSWCRMIGNIKNKIDLQIIFINTKSIPLKFSIRDAISIIFDTFLVDLGNGTSPMRFVQFLYNIGLNLMLVLMNIIARHAWDPLHEINLAQIQWVCKNMQKRS